MNSKPYGIDVLLLMLPFLQFLAVLFGSAMGRKLGFEVNESVSTLLLSSSILTKEVLRPRFHP